MGTYYNKIADALGVGNGQENIKRWLENDN